MAWADVPTKLTQYDGEAYAPDDAANTLLREYGVTDVLDVPLGRQASFERSLDYRLEACVNINASRAIHPSKLQG